LSDDVEDDGDDEGVIVRGGVFTGGVNVGDGVLYPK
jgi:hypothetical protein